MKFASTGTPVESPSKRREGDERRSGFTLVEALVSLSLLLTFAAALGPVLSHGRHILAKGNGQVRAELLLRSVLESALDPSEAAIGFREGESGGFRWRVAIEPFTLTPPDSQPAAPAGKSPYNWSLYKISTRVFWGHDQSIMAETLRLGRID